MGNRSLIEINHDTVHKLREQPQGFVERLYRYCASSLSESRDALDRHDDVRVVAMRHSADRYYISDKVDGFPSRLPYEEEVVARSNRAAKAIAHAKTVFPTGKGTTKDQLLQIVGTLLENATDSIVYAAALDQIEQLGSDGEHSGDRHARCRDIARDALTEGRDRARGLGER